MGPRNEAPRRRSKAVRRQPARDLRARWQRLHRGDRESWPDERLIGRLAKQSRAFAASVEEGERRPTVLAQGLQQAWQEFHAGDFDAAIMHGSALGALGASVANKAAAVDTLYFGGSAAQALRILEAAIARGEKAVEVLPDYPNAHYFLALVLGRYSQRISIVKALAAGLAGRVRTHLERTLQLEPQHAEAHVAFGLYHAEIVGKLGALAASVAYGVSRAAAIDHFTRALKLAPASPIVHIEYANGLMLLDAGRHREEARTLYAQAAAVEAADAMERLDCERARRGVG